MEYSREVISFNYDGVVLRQLLQKAVWRVPDRRGGGGDWIHGTQRTSDSKTWGLSVQEFCLEEISAIHVGFGWNRLS
jgi:hypothetical protein